MKKIILFFLSCLILSTSQTYSQSGWVKQHPKWAPIPKGDVFSAQIFGNNIYATSSGYFIRSSNAGLDWYSPNYGANMLSSFINSSTGFSDGDSVYKTTDGGITWTQIVPSQYNFLQFKILNENFGYGCGYGGVVGIAPNGGFWYYIQTPVEHALWTIDMLDENVGVVGSDSGRIMRTSNGGNNWNIVAHFPSVSVRGIAFASSQVAVAVGERNAPVMRSTNGGLNWTTLAPLPETFVRFVDFMNTQTGFVAAYDGDLYRTTDAGLTWNWYSDVPVGNAHSFQFEDNNRWIGCGNGFALTTNAGQNWNSLIDRGITATSFYGIEMFSENEIIAVGDSATIFHSSTGGQIWSKRTSDLGPFSIIRDVNFGSQTTGWIGANNGKILKSTDRGLTWFSLNSGVSGNINSLSFIDEYNGLAVSNGGHVLRTTNGGTTWVTTFLGTGFTCAVLADVNIGYISRGSAIYKSTDGGVIWTLLSTPPTLSGFNVIDFINTNTGFAKYHYGVLKTTNGGMDWETIVIPEVTEVIDDLEFSNATTGFISGVNAMLLKTTNGGLNWEKQYTGISKNQFRSLSMFNNNIVAIGGEYGMVLKTTNGGTIGISNITTEIPSFFKLHQNYPNPFNPSTKINFDLPKSGFTSLKIYDIAGKEAAELVNQNLQAGTYSYDFKGADFSSGIYFYVLRSGDYFETKKMVLLK